MASGIIFVDQGDGTGPIGGAFRHGPVASDGYVWADYDIDQIPDADMALLRWDGAQVVVDSAAEDQAARDATSAQARRVLADEHDAQQQEYERDTRLGNTPQADSYTYTARDGTEHTGRDALDRWGDDLRHTIREAATGTLDPAEELPAPPS